MRASPHNVELNMKKLSEEAREELSDYLEITWYCAIDLGIRLSMHVFLWLIAQPFAEEICALAAKGIAFQPTQLLDWCNMFGAMPIAASIAILIGMLIDFTIDFIGNCLCEEKGVRIGKIIKAALFEALEDGLLINTIRYNKQPYISPLIIFVIINFVALCIIT